MKRYTDFLIIDKVKLTNWKSKISKYHEIIYEDNNCVFLIWSYENKISNSYPNNKTPLEFPITIGAAIPMNSDQISGHYIQLTPSNAVININVDFYETLPIYHDDNMSLISTSCSEIKHFIDKKINIDPQGSLETILLGFSIRPSTEYKEVKQVVKDITVFPEYIMYSKQIKESGNIHVKNKKEALKLVDSKIKETYNQIDIFTGESTVDFGLSGGMDSRLNLAYLLKTNIRFNPHTLYKGTLNKDSKIAHNIADAVGFHLREIKLSKKQNNYVSTAQNVFEFYDERALSTNSYLSANYSREYRLKILDNHKIVLAGFGGEIFRNYRYLPNRSQSFKNWFFNHMTFSSGIYYSQFIPIDFIKEIEWKVGKRIQKDVSRMNKSKHFEYYSKIFLSDAIGPKIAVESRLAHYIAPFLFKEIRELSKIINPFLGQGFGFQSELLHSISPETAMIDTTYNFRPGKRTFKLKLTECLKSNSPSFLRHIIIRKKLNQTNTSRYLEILQQVPELKGLLNEVWEKFQISESKEHIFKNTESGDTLMSLALQRKLQQ